MRTPGFTAEQSVGRTRYTYRTVGRGALGGGSTVVAQQDEGGGTDAICCNKDCASKPCHCSGHKGYCDEPSHVDEPEYLMQGVIDFCQSTDGKVGAACSCGCWADAHDAGCSPCQQPPDPIYI